MYLSDDERREELINQQLSENKHSQPLISIYRKLSSDYAPYFAPYQTQCNYPVTSEGFKHGRKEAITSNWRKINKVRLIDMTRMRFFGE